MSNEQTFQVIKIGNTELTDSASNVFGDMVIRAMSRLDKYHSDLFHDAHALDRIMSTDDPAVEFYFVVRSWGTHIAPTVDVVHKIVCSFGADLDIWHYQVEIENSKTTLRVEHISVDTLTAP